jgi:Fe-S-cluster containining protein
MEALLHLFHRARPPEARVTGCLCCGRCCESFGGHLHASKRDLARWKAEGREDLLRRVSAIGWLWMDPVTGRLALDGCPFLVRESPERALCAIQETKPDMCREYPTLAHGKRCPRGGFLAWTGLLIGCEELLELASQLGAC